MSARVLYVDDDRHNLIVFRAAFAGDLDILTASNGAEALAVLERERDIALLVTDQRMPGMTGTQLAEIVRRDHPHVIRYLITAYADLGAAIDAINVGEVHRYLRKPWDPVELRINLREGLELFDLAAKVRGMERRMREVERVYALGVVAASVVHELRNPMTVIAGYLELARIQGERLVELGGAEAVEPGEELDRTITGAWDAVVRMNEISRAVELSSRSQLESRRADLGGVVEMTLRLIGNELRYRAMLAVELAPGLMVPLDTTRLGQVVLNLTVNAMEALRTGRPHSDGKVRIAVSGDGERARLEVSDNGVGVPDDLKVKIFDPFFTTKVDGGTGLGLAISRQIIERAGGTLRIEDTEGGGATFVVELPLADL